MPGPSSSCVPWSSAPTRRPLSSACTHTAKACTKRSLRAARCCDTAVDAHSVTVAVLTTLSPRPSATLMRHFLSTCAFAAPVAIAALALGVTVPAASRLLIVPPGPAQLFASGEAATQRPAVLLAAVTGRADEDLALAPRAQKQSGIVHRSPRRGGLDDPTSPGNTALGAVRKCGSGAPG